MEKTQNRIKCYECEGYEHIASECANTLKKSRQKKAMNITQSEDENRESNSYEEDIIDDHQENLVYY